VKDSPNQLELPPTSFDGQLLDLSGLVGRDISLYPEQTPGRELKGRVVSVHDRQIHLDGQNRRTDLDNLVNNQRVIIKFRYRGQAVSVRASLKRTAGGRCFFVMEEKVTPLSQRRHVRVPIVKPVKLAPFPMSTFVKKSLPHLRWIETETINFSSGGALLDIPSRLEKEVYLLINIDLQTEMFPTLILGQVRHNYAADTGRFHTGIEFVVKESARSLVPALTARELPAPVLAYSAQDRERLNKHIQAWMPEAQQGM
jgi:hypothetical protein